MAGTSSKTSVVTIRVSNELLARWRKASEARGETITAYIIREMAPPVASLNLPVLTDFPKRDAMKINPKKGKQP